MSPERSPQAIANIICTHQIYSRIYGEGETFVMVEGKTDQVLWEEFRSKEDCTIYPVKGKSRILATLDITKKSGNRGVAGIVDGDYWLITQAEALGVDNLLYDNCYPDMELMLLSSDALKKFLRNSFYNYDIEQVHEFVETMKHESQRLAMEFGYFRLLNHIKDYGIKFEGIDFSEVIDRDTLELDREWVAKRLAEQKTWISSEGLLSEADELQAKYPPENIQLCCGKDVISIMSTILPNLFKAEFDEDLPDNMKPMFHDRQLSISLRSAYEYMYFKDTSLFDCIQLWESANAPYKILNPEI
ncbi:MAG: DUF4435 domain-containing protein [Chloroflexi bacterium]|nr:DUF4435 domain-containing protein [Chloroflexota bacterium]